MFEKPIFFKMKTVHRLTATGYEDYILLPKIKAAQTQGWWSKRAYPRF